MTDWIQGVFHYVEKLWQWVYCFWDNLSCKLLDIFSQWTTEIVNLVLAAFASIPVPDALASFQFPSGGPLVDTMLLLNVPQALAMIAAAFTVRYMKSLIKMVVK